MSVTYALALPESRARRQTQLYGTRAQLAVGNGDVEGYLALAGCDKRAGTASYALRIVNQSSHLLRARMTCARLRGEAILAYPLDIHIAPFSISETLLPVRVADIGPYDRAIVQVAGGDVAFSLEAPAPSRMISKRSRWMMVTAASLALTLGTAFAAAASTPRLALLAAPVRALGGTTLDVPYAFGGWASMQYELQTRDGRQLSAGLLKSHQGTLHFTVPPTAGPNVVLSVNVAGPFGRQSRTQKIAIASGTVHKPQGALTAPHISDFAVVTPIVHAGSQMTFKYTTDAREGEVWLLDETGRLWARAPINAYGETTLTVPQGAAGRQMRAVLHARNKQLDAVASLGVMVMPGTIAPDAQAPDAPKMPNAGMTLSTEKAAPGDIVTVMIDGAHGDARIAMTDGSGQSVEQGDIPSSQNAVTITAPSVTRKATYYVIASISQGAGNQTIVRKLVVAPR